MNQVPRTKSAGGIVLNSKGDILLVQEFGEYWGLPRGHIESGETVEFAARREIEEETGVTDLVKVADLGSYARSTFGSDGLPDYREIKHITLFAFRTNQIKLISNDSDITDLGWFKVDQVEVMLINKDDREFYAKSIKRLEKLALINKI